MRLLTTQEVADVLHCTRSNVIRKIHHGTLPAIVDARGAYRIAPAALRQYQQHRDAVRRRRDA